MQRKVVRKANQQWQIRHLLLYASILIILLAAGAVFAQLPYPLQQYKQLLQQSGGVNAGVPVQTQNVSKYSAPQMYRPETLEVARPEETKQKISPEDTLPYFDEPVIVAGETIQVIRKATPRYLKRYGADFFNNIPTIQTAQLPVSGNYVLGTGDRIVLNAWGSLNAQYDLVVDRDGSIYIPEVGNVAVAGLTLDKAEGVVRKVLQNNYSDVNVDLTLGETKSVRVFVVGQVKYPGIYDLPGLSRVLTALAAAGGPDSVGSYRDIKVYRGNKEIANFDLYEFITQGRSAGNIQLASGDVVFVPHYNILVKLRGRVKSPAEYELKTGESIKDLLRFAGGLLPDGNRNAIFVDRIVDGYHRSLTINLDDSASVRTILRDGDDISVFPVNPYREDVVFVDGYTPQPGAYGWYKGMRLSELFKNANSLYPDTYLDRVDIIRNVNGELKKKILSANLGRALEGDKAEDIELKPHDRIILYSEQDFTEEKFVNIYGAVRHPGRYKLYDNMRISDLVFEAGGLKEYAFTDSVELVRLENGRDFKVFNINLREILQHPGGNEDILLQKEDYLFIRSIPDWQHTRMVTILGEVKFPGTYALVREDETLSELIKRAGGITDKAFLEGAVFTRPAVSSQIEKRNILRVIRNTREVVKDTAGNIDTTSLVFMWNPDELNNIIIDLRNVINGKEDIVLQSGDTIFIPRKPEIVSVIGAVGASGTIKYLKGKRVKYYIERAGGLTKLADVGEIRLVKPNGKVVKVGLSYKDVGPGDVIVVPQRIKKERDVLKIVSEITSIITGLATTIYILLKI